MLVASQLRSSVDPAISSEAADMSSPAQVADPEGVLGLEAGRVEDSCQ